jgi:hypothetical protein
MEIPQGNTLEKAQVTSPEAILELQIPSSEVPLDQPPLRGRPVAAAVIDNINNKLPIAHLFRFERSNDSIPPRPP